MAIITLKASNVSLKKDAPIAHLTADAAATAATINVENVTGFADDDYMMLGELESPTAEILQINDGSLDTSITLQSATVYDHYVGEPVYRIKFNQVEFSRATTLAGVKSVLSTTEVTPDRLDTIYNDATNSTGYWFWRFKNANDTVYSDYSVGQNYTGLTENTVARIIERGRALAGVDDNSDKATEVQCMADCNMAQDAILQSRDTRTGVNINWAFELASDDTSISTTQNENTYALSGLSSEIKYPDTYEAVLNLRIGSKVLSYVDPNKMDRMLQYVVKTAVATQATAGDTTLVVDDTNELNESGSIVVGGDTVTYTAKVDSTATLSGIPASGSGSITATHLVDATVWQGISPGLPQRYTIFNGYITLDRPVESTYAGWALKFKYLYKLSRFTDIADTTDVAFFNIFEYFVASRIEARKGNSSESANLMNMFREGLANNMRRYKLPPLEELRYFNFDNARSATAGYSGNSINFWDYRN